MNAKFKQNNKNVEIYTKVDEFINNHEKVMLLKFNSNDEASKAYNNLYGRYGRGYSLDQKENAKVKFSKRKNIVVVTKANGYEKQTYVLCVALSEQEFNNKDFTECCELNTVNDCKDLASQYDNDFYIMYVVAEDGSIPWKKESVAYKKSVGKCYCPTCGTVPLRGAKYCSFCGFKY